MDFSLFYFNSAGQGPADRKYESLFACVREADRSGLAGVWIPERHFSAFGGLYPDPLSVLAALSRASTRLPLRAGSIVLPLHDLDELVEECLLMQALCGGRFEAAVAAGWHPNDFALRPERYAQRKSWLPRGVWEFAQAWSGRSSRPSPLKWFTAASPQSAALAGSLGLNLLARFDGHAAGELAQMVAAYRLARAEAGFGPGRIALMVMTMIGTDAGALREAAAPAYRVFMRQSFFLTNQAWARPGPGGGLTDDDMDFLSDQHLERLIESHGLIGSERDLGERVRRFEDAGVDELACLYDFHEDGGHTARTLDGIMQLAGKT